MIVCKVGPVKADLRRRAGGERASTLFDATAARWVSRGLVIAAIRAAGGRELPRHRARGYDGLPWAFAAAAARRLQATDSSYPRQSYREPRRYHRRPIQGSARL